MGEELEVEDPISNGYDDGVNKTSRLRLNRLHVFSFRFDTFDCAVKTAAIGWWLSLEQLWCILTFTEAFGSKFPEF